MLEGAELQWMDTLKKKAYWVITYSGFEIIFSVLCIVVLEKGMSVLYL